jgi:hypothetical protein
MEICYIELRTKCPRAFESLKEKLSKTPVLSHPDFKSPFIVTTDGSKFSIAANLSQVQEGIKRPIALASRKLIKAQRAYSVSDLEMLVLVWTTKYFRWHLCGRKFSVRADHAALKVSASFCTQQ